MYKEMTRMTAQQETFIAKGKKANKRQPSKAAILVINKEENCYVFSNFDEAPSAYHQLLEKLL